MTEVIRQENGESAFEVKETTCLLQKECVDMDAAVSHGNAPNRAFIWAVLAIQFVMVAMYALMIDLEHSAEAASHSLDLYTWFQHVHVMIFVGFGFLMTFLRRYSLSAVGINMLLGAVALQIHVHVKALWASLIMQESPKATLDIRSLIEGDFCAGALLISFGAVLGKASPMQMVLLALVETVFYSANEVIAEKLSIVDDGGSMVIHLFGAVFGLAASWVITPRGAKNHENEGSSYHSDIFSMIGTLFLWMYWPSFNGALVNTDGTRPVLQMQAAVLTVISLCASCMGAFALSAFFRGRFSPVDIQNATLAGGVAIGSVCAVEGMSPALGGLVGFAAGCVSVAGFARLQGFLLATIGLHDTCGVLNLHGLPGAMGGIMSIVCAHVWGAGGNGAAVQAIFMGTTIGISAVGGVLAGLAARLSVFSPTRGSFYDDVVNFHVE